MVFTDITISGVEHFQEDSPGANKEGYVVDSALAGIRGNIQPTNPEITALAGGMYGRMFTLFTTASGIQDGDRVTVSGTRKQYLVKGRQYFSYGPGQHGEYLLEEPQ